MDIQDFYNSILNIRDEDKSKLIMDIVSREKQKLLLYVDDFTGFCKYIANQIRTELVENNVNVYLIDLNDIVGVDHVSLISEYKHNEKIIRHLIDPTYIQFYDDGTKELVSLDFWPSTKLDNIILDKLLLDGFIQIDNILFNKYINSFSKKEIKIDLENYLLDLKLRRKNR